MIKCILSTTIPQSWIPALVYAEGIEPRDENELDAWLKENGLTGAETFDLGPEEYPFVRCAVFVDSDDPRPEVAVYEDQYDCEAWLQLRLDGEWPPRWKSAAELAAELLPNAGPLDAPVLQAIIDDATGED